MQKKIVLTVFAMILLASLPYLAAHNIISLSSPETIICVDPSEKGVVICDEFDININVTNVVNLSMFMFNLSYESTFLRVLDVAEGYFPNEENLSLPLDRPRARPKNAHQTRISHLTNILKPA